MTPEEIIATKLLGWRSLDTPPSGFVYINECYANTSWLRDGAWPDLSNWNDIRRMEDALAEKGLTMMYISHLHTGTGMRLDVACLRATAEQRVQAALKVIEEAEASAAKEELASELAQQRSQAYRSSLRAKVKDLESRMRCNCDLDRWEPEATTNHSKVCRIHRTAIEVVKY